MYECLHSTLLHTPNKRQSRTDAPSRAYRLNAEFALDFYRKLYRNLRFPSYLYLLALSCKVCFFLSTNLYSSPISVKYTCSFDTFFLLSVFAYFRIQYRHMFFPIPRIRLTVRPLFPSIYSFIAYFLISSIYPRFFPS